MTFTGYNFSFNHNQSDAKIQFQELDRKVTPNGNFEILLIKGHGPFQSVSLPVPVLQEAFGVLSARVMASRLVSK